MDNTQGSRVRAQGSSTSYVRGNAVALAWVAALCAALVFAPLRLRADTIFQSAPDGDEEMQIITPGAPHLYFGGTADIPSVQLGVWEGPDFTTDTSTTIHLWARWNGVFDGIFDVNIRASEGGDPTEGATTTAQISSYDDPQTDAGPYRLPVLDTPDLEEYVVPTQAGEVIHHGDQIWAQLISSWNSYGADHWIAASGPMPFIQICEGDCSATTTDIYSPSSVCTQDCFSNVLFIPGIEASRLYDTDDDGTVRKLWEPSSSDDAEDLAFTEDGVSKDTAVFTRDIIDDAYLYGEGNIYASFIADMDALKQNGSINDWASAPYDWRYTPEQLLTRGLQDGDDIFYGTTTDTPYLISTLKRLAASSKTGKVTIIAHSSGGLVAKALLQQLGDAATSQLVDKVILVGVPQVGTPAALAGLLHGYGEGITILGSTKLTDASAREVGDTLPGMYDLVPSTSYFTYVDDPVITFSGAPAWAARYGDPIHSVDRLDPFLTDATRQRPPALDVEDPRSLNGSYLAQANADHQSLDAWVPPADVHVIQIAGWGMPETMSGISYASSSNADGSSVVPDPIFTVDGDGTVVVPSALWIPASANVDDYWLDLAGYNDDHFIASLGGANGLAPYEHQTLFEVSDLLDFLTDEITDALKPLSAYPHLFTAAPASTGHRLRFELPSSFSIDVYDRSGDHTGVSTTTGDMEEAIPGSSYTKLAQTQYVFVEEHTDVHVVITSEATTTLTFEVDELDGNDDTVASTTFKDVPVDPGAKATVDVDGSIASTSPLSVDEDDDGTPELSLPPGDTVVDQPEAPSTETSPDLATTTDVVASTTLGSEDQDPSPNDSDVDQTSPDDDTTMIATTTTDDTSNNPTVVSNGEPVAVVPSATSSPQRSAHAEKPPPHVSTTTIALVSATKPTRRPLASHDNPIRLGATTSTAPSIHTATIENNATLLAGAAAASSSGFASIADKLPYLHRMLDLIRHVYAFFGSFLICRA